MLRSYLLFYQFLVKKKTGTLTGSGYTFSNGSLVVNQQLAAGPQFVRILYRTRLITTGSGKVGKFSFFATHEAIDSSFNVI